MMPRVATVPARRKSPRAEKAPASVDYGLSVGGEAPNGVVKVDQFRVKDMHSGRLTPIIGAYPKAFVPLITVLPGMAALVLLPGIGTGGNNLKYNEAIPALMDKYLPSGVLGVAVMMLCSTSHKGVTLALSILS